MWPQAGGQLVTPDALSVSVAPRRPGGTVSGSQRSQRFMPDCEALSRRALSGWLKDLTIPLV
jgi:hypothetical protein